MRCNYFLIISAICSIFFLIGCSGDAVKEPESIDQVFPPTMTGQIVINGVAYPMEKGAYTWERKNGLGTTIVTTDHASPYQMAEHIEAIRTNPNQKIDLTIEGNPAIKVYVWGAMGRSKELKREADQLIVPSSEGTYIYEVVADWPNGTISYTFVIEIVPL